VKKIISLFKRDYEGTRQVYDEIVPGAEWVVAGEGVATAKWDGTACMVRDGVLYKRYDRRLKKGTYKPVAKAAILGAAGYAVKAIREQDGGQVIGGYLLLWGGPKQKDLQGDYFTPATELWLDHYKSAPTLFHHGLDDTVGLAQIGRRITAKSDDTGVWVEDWIDKSNRYWAVVEPLLEAERLYYSPGSAPHLIKRAKSGELLSFPVVEDTLTPMPAQYRLRPIEEIEATYKSANIELNLPDEERESGDSELERARLLAQAATILSEPTD